MCTSLGGDLELAYKKACIVGAMSCTFAAGSVRWRIAAVQEDAAGAEGEGAM